MPILVVCPGCGAKMNAPDSAAGRKVRCPKPDCQAVATVPAATAAAAAPAPPPPPPKAPAEDADPFGGLGGGDDRPRGKSRRDDRDDDRPRSRRDEDEDDRPRGKGRRDEEDDRPRSRRDDRDDRDDDDRPRNKRRRDEDEDDRPRGKGRRDEEDDDRPRGRRDDRDEEDDRPRGKGRRDAAEDEDYDDRPRRGRGRGKAGGGKKTWVIVAVVAGLIVLLGGGGYLVYSLVGGSKAAVPPGWKEYTSAEDGFKGYFPKDVTKLAAGVPAGGGGPDFPGFGKGGTTSVYTSGAATDPVQVQLTVTRMPGGIPKEMRELMAKMGEMQKELQKAFGPGKGGPEIRTVKWLGEQATEVAGPNGVERTAMTSNAVYHARVSGPKNARAKPEEEAAFFDNFTLK